MFALIGYVKNFEPAPGPHVACGFESADFRVVVGLVGAAVGVLVVDVNTMGLSG